MISSRLELKQIAGKELDKYLKKGWYRMGQSIFTTQFLSFDDNIYTALWLRMNLQGYTMRKSLRKIYKKVHNNFRVIIQPATFGFDKEVLFMKYKKHFKGSFNSTITSYMLDNKHQNVYQTLECLVYDNERLIAFSYFDLGEKCIASILGVYDYEYNKYSLGIFTMLAEINWAVEKNYEWYYPGYSVPGYKRFDYKQRVGEMEYYDYAKKKWFSFQDFSEDTLLTEKLKTKLNNIHQHIGKFIGNGYFVFYRYFDMWYLKKTDIYDHPLMLLYVVNQRGYVVEYDFKKEIYRLSRIITINLNFTVNETVIENQKIIELRSPLMCEDIIIEAKEAKEVADELILLLLLEE